MPPTSTAATWTKASSMPLDRFVHQDLLPSVTGFTIGDYDTWVAAGPAGPDTATTSL